MSNLWNIFKVEYAQGHDLDEQVPVAKLHEDYARWLEQRCAVLEQAVKEGVELMDIYTYPGTTDADEWVARAKALIGGASEPGHTE